jgi:hypothetical protein
MPFTEPHQMTYYRALAAEPELLDIGWDVLETAQFIKLAQYLKPYIASTIRREKRTMHPCFCPLQSTIFPSSHLVYLMLQSRLLGMDYGLRSGQEMGMMPTRTIQWSLRKL